VQVCGLSRQRWPGGHAKDGLEELRTVGSHHWRGGERDGGTEHCHSVIRIVNVFVVVILILIF
jgi:hypothetical protein